MKIESDKLSIKTIYLKKKHLLLERFIYQNKKIQQVISWDMHMYEVVSTCAFTSTFSTTCFPNEHTLVEQVIAIFSLLSYLQCK